jgi:hypothetical protein
MKVKKLDRRYSMCRFNNYWVALHFDEKYNGNPYEAYWIKCKLQDHYGPSGYAMFNNPSPWYNEYKDGGEKEIIYLRDESMLTFLQLVGALDES